MIDADTQITLQRILRREGRTLLQYIHDAYPWTTTAQAGQQPEVQRMSRAEQEAVASLSQYLFRRHIPPAFLGSYPAHFTSFNFVSLAWLLPRLAQQQAKDIADLEADFAKLTDPGARAQIESMLTLKKKHLAELQSLAQPPSAAG
jgi:hypothetical protein